MIQQVDIFKKPTRSKKTDKYTITGEASFNGTNIITIQINHNGKRAGKIVARNGALHFFPKNKTYGKRIPWSQFERMMGEG